MRRIDGVSASPAQLLPCINVLIISVIARAPNIPHLRMRKKRWQRISENWIPQSRKKLISTFLNRDNVYFLLFYWQILNQTLCRRRCLWWLEWMTNCMVRVFLSCIDRAAKVKEDKYKWGKLDDSFLRLGQRNFRPLLFCHEKSGFFYGACGKWECIEWHFKVGDDGNEEGEKDAV